jgi:hypothetical protein
MWCRSCQSQHVAMYGVEMCIHPRGGLKSLSNPATLAFPKVLVCSDCGFAEFALGESELQNLKRSDSLMHGGLSDLNPPSCQMDEQAVSTLTS